MLGTKQDETNVQDAYNAIKQSFPWAGNETAKRTSEFQDYFMKNSKEDDPLVFKNFEDLLNATILRPRSNSTKLQTQNYFKDSRDKLKAWLESNPQNPKNVRNALDNFVNVFDDAIAKFSGRG